MTEALVEDRAKRLARLEREMIRCIGGDFDARLTLSERSDELDAIATGINILLDEVQHAMGVAARRGEDAAALQKQALLFEAIQDGVMVIGSEGTVVAWNPAACELFGLSSEEVVGGSPFPMFSDEVSLRLEGEVMRALERERVWLGEVEVEGASGTLRTCQVTIVPVSGSGDEMVGRVQNFRDVTDSRLLEQRVQHAERLKSLGLLAGGVAHDFNNQLTGIQTAAEVLQKMLIDEQGTLSTYVESILLASRRAANLTEQLLAFARRGPRRCEPVNVNDLIQEVSELVRRGSDKRIKVTLDLSDEYLDVEGDASQLQNVFLNIAFNARDAMPLGGEFRISTSCHSLEAGSVGAPPLLVQGGHYVRIILSDTGIGMSEEVKCRIFEPFYTTKPQGQGVGMGLATVFGVVEVHGGAIAVVSETTSRRPHPHRRQGESAAYYLLLSNCY